MTTTKKPRGGRRKAREVWLHIQSDGKFVECDSGCVGAPNADAVLGKRVLFREVLPAPKRGGRKG